MGYVTVGSIDDYYKKALAASQPQQDKALADTENLYSQQKQGVEGIYKKKISDTEAAYEDSYRENAVQKLINERAIAENMANLGLTDSGLNRTQQTAAQLSYANNKLSIDRQKQAQVDTLAQSLAAELANIESGRLAAKANITNQYSQAAMESAYALRNADIENNNEIYKAELEAAQKAATQQQTEGKSLYDYLPNISGDPDHAAQLIDTYCSKYDIDPNTKQGYGTLTALLKAAGMTEGQYMQYLGHGSVYTTAADYAGGNTNGIVKWDYKTDGKQKYKIEVVKDTINWFGGVDGNAVVNIYYADGTLLKENVKLSSLSRDVAKEITKLTKGSGNEGEEEILTLDLSKEKF